MIGGINPTSIMRLRDSGMICVPDGLGFRTTFQSFGRSHIRTKWRNFYGLRVVVRCDEQSGKRCSCTTSTFPHAESMDFKESDGERRSGLANGCWCFSA